MIEPEISREGDPDAIRRHPVYLDTVDAIWQRPEAVSGLDAMHRSRGYPHPDGCASLILWAVLWEIVGQLS